MKDVASFFTSVLLTVICCCCDRSRAIIFEGSLNTGDSFALVGRFAFGVAPTDSAILNQVTIETTHPLAYENLVIGLYFDDWETWQAYNQDNTCIEKISFATRLLCTTNPSERCPDGDNVLSTGWTETDRFISSDGVNMTSGSANYAFSANNEVEWFWIVLANCNARACSGT